MTTRGQIVVSVAIVALATGALVANAVFTGGKGAAVAVNAHAAHQGGPAVDGGSQPVRLDADAARRIGVTYATATVKPLIHEVRAVGNIAYDEQALVDFSPKIEGWVERLHVNFAGAPVRRGQPLMEVYSPMLVSAQEELILARRLVDQAGASERASATARELLESARRRLRYWDIPDAEIAEVERTGTPRRTLTLTAPSSGIVIEKNVVHGTRIMPGMNLYRIADLSRVWVEVDVFEKDLSLLQLGQHAVITFEAYAGEVFEGLATYVYPTIDAGTRTGRVRLELDNPGGRLKPGMYAQVLLHLVPREAVVVPRTAVLETGERALVFVRGGDGALLPREVGVGLAVGPDVEITAGLAAGDEVVASAGFLIDAESNLRATVDAMAADGGNAGGRVPAAAPGAHSGH